jgi:uncharacterized protein YbaP (TraB family)
MRLVITLAVAITALIGSTASSAAPPETDPEGTVVQELVVTSRAGGPAWWRVSNATSTVYILGAPEALPKGLKWDTTLLQRRLRGANELVGPASVSANLGDIFALMNARKRFRSHGAMEDGLPPELRARFLAMRASLNADPRAYSGWTPLVASLLVVSDFRRRARLDRLEPAATVVRLARRENVRVIAAGTYRFVPMVKAAEIGLSTSGPACLADALDEVQAGAGLIERAAQAWAVGDVATALTAQRGYEKCLSSLPAGADLPTRAMADTASAIAAALAIPGHSVAVVNLRALLARGGVLQRLQAQGFHIATPDR